MSDLRPLTAEDVLRIENALDACDADRPEPDAHIGERQRASLHALNLHSWIVETYGRRIVAHLRRALREQES
jgi:hypothetical protein